MASLFVANACFGILSYVSHSNATYQQFWSAHLIAIIAVAGTLIGMGMSSAFRNKSGVWVWVPFCLVFLLRVISWRHSGSVLFVRGTIVDHFFLADCEFDKWSEGGWGEQCGDKLFLTPLFLSGIFYSAGAWIHRIWGRGTHSPSAESTAATTPNGLHFVTTRLRALIVLAFTASSLALQLQRSANFRSSSLWLFRGMFPGWALVIVNIAFWSAIYYIGISLVFTPLRKDEKALLVSYAFTVMLIPVRTFLSHLWISFHIVTTILSLVGFLAALSILISLSKQRLETASH